MLAYYENNYTFRLTMVGNSSISITHYLKTRGAGSEYINTNYTCTYELYTAHVDVWYLHS